jgi:hypothetical protein
LAGNLRFRRRLLYSVQRIFEDSASFNCLPRKLHSAKRLSCTLFLPLLRNQERRFQKSVSAGNSKAPE